MMGESFAKAINDAVSLLLIQGERIAELEGRLKDNSSIDLTPEEIEFFRNPKWWKF